MTAPTPSGGRRAALAAAALLATLSPAVGCGGDDEEAGGDTSTSGQPPTKTVTVPATTAPEPKRTKTSPSPKGKADKPQGSPEDQPGGAGDEEPARSEVVLTGRGGRIGPLLVKVPPFISIHVVLRSGDGKPYVLSMGRRVLRAGLKASAASATFDGLRPGRRLVGSAVSGRVVIEASAEPGP